MIVGRVFEGDDDADTRDLQEDVFHDALQLIVFGCRKHYARATKLLQITDPLFDRVCANKSIDHRTIQTAHNLIAAYWRFHTRRTHPVLPFEDKDTTKRKAIADWLAWLQAEIDSWVDEPHLVRTLIFCLANANTQPGNQAEEALALALRERYRSMYDYARTALGRCE